MRGTGTARPDLATWRGVGRSQTPDPAAWGCRDVALASVQQHGKRVRVSLTVLGKSC